MKKILSLLMCLVMLFSVMFTLTGCFGEQSKYIGKWKATLDLTDIMNEELANNEDMGDYFTLTDFSVVMFLEFNDDGTYSMYVEEESIEKAMEKMVDDLIDAANEKGGLDNIAVVIAKKQEVNEAC